MTQAEVQIVAVLLTVKETAERLNIGRSKMYELVLSGEVESVQIGRLRRIPAVAVDAYVSSLRATQVGAP